MRIDVEGQVTNTSTTEPIYTTMCILPFVDASVSTLKPQTVADFPRAQVFMTGVSTGLSFTKFKGSFAVADYVGEENVGRTFLQDYSQAITSGVQGEFPAIYIGNSAAKIGNSWSGQFEVRFKMHIRFSGLNYPSLGLNRFPPVDEISEEWQTSDPDRSIQGDFRKPKPQQLLNCTSSNGLKYVVRR